MFQVIPEPIEEILAVLEYWDHIFSGFLMTMWLYGWAILIGFFLGLFLAILRQYKSTYRLGIVSDISANLSIIGQITFSNNHKRARAASCFTEVQILPNSTFIPSHKLLNHGPAFAQTSFIQAQSFTN